MYNLTNENENYLRKVEFSWYDYTLFSVMLGMSALIGIYFGCFGQKQSTAKEYLHGGKTMKVFPIAMSLIASHTSGITILAVPADIYKFGSNYAFILVSVAINCLLTSYVFLPIFHKLQITSTYEYLKLRFNTKIQILSSLLFTLSMVLYLPIVVYIPALAFAEVTSINLHLINPVVCAICIFYTTIGGLKAVVWTDTLQFTAMVGAILAVLYMGISSVGGLGTVWNRSLEGKRLDIDFDINPTKRDTFWACIIGWTLNWIPQAGIGQGTIQKVLSLPSLRDGRMSLLIFGIGSILCKGASIFTGLIIYAKYFNCDPFLTKRVTNNDQLLPYYVMDVAHEIPGLPGLFIAGLFCAALSTLSAAMNALSGTIYEDFISRYVSKDISQKKVSQILKLIVFLIGIIATILVFVIEHLGGLLPLSITFSGLTAGPLVGLFVLGMLFPSSNSKGAFAGAVSSLLFISWMVIGAQWYKARGLLTYTPKPMSTEGCNFQENITIYSDSNPTMKHETEDIFILYRISYYYYTLIGVVVVLLVGLPVSWCTRKNNLPVNRDLITPFMQWTVPESKPRNESVKYYTVEKALTMVDDKTS